MAADVSFRNLDSIMQAAEAEATTMTENSSEFSTAEEVPASIPIAAPIVTGEDVKSAMSAANIGSMLNRMTNNPEEVTRMMHESMKTLSPEVMQQARNMAMGAQGQQIRKEMQRRGINPQAMRKQLLEQKRALQGTSAQVSSDATAAIIVTTSRQVRTRKLSQASLSLSAAAILHAEAPVELSCSRLAKGPLTGKSIKIWYDPNHPGKNKRTSRIIGFPVGGEMLIVVEGEDLSEKDFLAAEKFLQ